MKKLLFFVLFSDNVLQSIYFIHDIPFFATTNFELNIFITIDMQFFCFAICLHHRCLTCSFEVLSKELGYCINSHIEHKFHENPMFVNIGLLLWHIECSALQVA